VKGDIAWVVGGLAPIRPNWDGLLPVPGDGRYEWAGFWRGDQLPSILNPREGLFSTANEMNLPADYPYKERKLGFEWSAAARQTRIQSVLKSIPKISIEDSMKLQTDITSIPARRLVRVLASLKSTEKTASAALALLRGWDGVERADSAQAALLEVWISRHLGRAYLDQVLPKAAAAIIRTPDMDAMLDALEKGSVRNRNTLLLDTLAAAYRETGQLLGPDSAKWRWGSLHHSFPAHPLLGVMPPAVRDKFQVGPFPKSGGPYTPSQSGYRASDYRQTGGPSFRIVVDVGNWDGSRAVNYPGQSGNPDDPHYRDLARLWLHGEYFPLLYTRAAIEKATTHRITLRPR
jgi:penicillin amidase